MAHTAIETIYASIPVNVTVDDLYPEEHIGTRIAYSDEEIWNVGQNCSRCIAQPDKNMVSNHSWHDTTFNTTGFPRKSPGTAAVNFTGTVYWYYSVVNISEGAC